MEVISHKKLKKEFLKFEKNSDWSDDEGSDATSPSKNFENESFEEFQIKPQNDLNIKIVVKKLANEFEVDDCKTDDIQEISENKCSNVNDTFKTKINQVSNLIE